MIAFGPRRCAATAVLSLLLFWLLVTGRADALEIREDFEWNWEPLCAARGVHEVSCFEILGCGNGRPLHVRRTSPGTCGYDSQVRFWTGAENDTSRRTNNPPPESDAARTTELAQPPPPAEMPAGENRWGAAHFRDPGEPSPNGNVFEILSSREPQSSRLGRMQVDFRIPEDVPVSGGGEHYLILHNLTVHGIPPCPQDTGDGCTSASRTSYGGIPGNASSYQWYGVIAGAFGSGSEVIPYGSVGFVVEVSAEGKGGNHLIDETFLPYSVNGEQKAFPKGTYRISIERGQASGVDTYGYSVQRWNETDGAFEPILPDGARSSHTVLVPIEDLTAPLGFELPLGYVGLSAAWFGESSDAGGGRNEIVWDNLVVDW